MENNKFYMNPFTGSVDTREGWLYTDESGIKMDPVENGEVIEVKQNSLGEWVTA